MADEKTATIEVKKNCAGCKKLMKKAKRYYRNGEYYCNKNCFKNKIKQKQSENLKEAKA